MSKDLTEIAGRLSKVSMSAPTPPPEQSSPSPSLKSLRPAELFDDIGTKYEDAFANRTQQDRAVDWLISCLPRNARVLDVGCGPGRVAARVSKAGHKVLGIDVSEVMVKAAKKRVPDATFERVDYQDFFTPGETYDGIVMQFALIVSISRAQLIEAFSKVFSMLKRGGVFAYASVAVSGESVPTKFLGRPIVASTFTTDETVQWLKNVGFEIVEHYEDRYQPKWVEGLCSADEVTPEPHVYVCAKKS